MNNTIILLKSETRISDYEKFNKGDTIWKENSEPEELKRWSIEQEEEAKAELKKYRCEYRKGVEIYYITEYALEYCKCDEDGEFIDGSDYELADVEE